MTIAEWATTMGIEPVALTVLQTCGDISNIPNTCLDLC